MDFDWSNYLETNKSIPVPEELFLHVSLHEFNSDFLYKISETVALHNFFNDLIFLLCSLSFVSLNLQVIGTCLYIFWNAHRRMVYF